jgi:hypothetical protein
MGVDEIFFFAGIRGRQGGQNAITINQTEVGPYNLALVIGAEEDKSCKGEGSWQLFVTASFARLVLYRCTFAGLSPHTHLRCLYSLGWYGLFVHSISQMEKNN